MRASATNRPQTSTMISATTNTKMLTSTNFAKTCGHLSRMSGRRKKVRPTAELFMKMKAAKPSTRSAKTPQPNVRASVSRAAAVSIRTITMSLAFSAAAALRAYMRPRIAGQNSSAVAAIVAQKMTSWKPRVAPRPAIEVRISEVVAMAAATQMAAKTRAAMASPSAGFGT